jgi:hypothetical protein
VLRVGVGGHPDLPAGGHEEDPMAIAERDRICWSAHCHAAPIESVRLTLGRRGGPPRSADAPVLHGSGHRRGRSHRGTDGCGERSGRAVSLSGPRTGGRRHDIRDERVRDRRVAADGIRPDREVSPLPGDALITCPGVDARPAVSGSDLLREGGAAAGSWTAGNRRARLGQREKSLGWLTLGSVHAESG